MTIGRKKVKSREPIQAPMQSELIPLAEMVRIEGMAKEEAWIVAEDQVVDYLVRKHLSHVTKANIRRGVNYRFLVSKTMRNEMDDFVEDTIQELKAEKPRGDSATLGRIEVHDIDADLMKLVMPGCLFDPRDLRRGCSFFRSTTEGPEGLQFHWAQLSPRHHTQYLEGFKLAWPPDRKRVSRALRLMTLFASIFGLMLGSAGWYLLKYLSFEPTRELVWSLLLGGGTWLGLIWMASLFPRISIIRRLPSFRKFETVVGIAVVSVVLNVLVNVLSGWLTR